MTEQPQVPQPEGQPSQQPPVPAPAPAPAPGPGSGFDFAALQKDLQTKTISVNNAWILTGIGAVLFISIFLAWWSAPSVEFLGERIGGGSLNGSQTAGGFLYITALAAVVGAALVALRKTALIGVAVGAVFALIQLIMTLSKLGVPASGSLSIGIWLSLLGSLAYLGGAVYFYQKDKQDYVSSGPLFPQQPPTAPPAA